MVIVSSARGPDAARKIRGSAEYLWRSLSTAAIYCLPDMSRSTGIQHDCETFLNLRSAPDVAAFR
ncbi:hypothetical protein AGR8A_Cc30113 [Agrobacterium fabrum str. J-07]|nr:hypothetical protein AGR8A_Cc30113 [Agrobacterium fabrum str. J-07]